jgi:hypothetical protein
MKLTKDQEYAITTVINLAFDICAKSDDSCNDCPFWTYCQHSDESIGNYLHYLFQKVLDN